MLGHPLPHHYAGDILAQMASRRLFIAGITLVLAFAVLLATHFWLLRQEFNAGIEAKAQITASRLIQPASANDIAAINRILQSLHDFPVITGATLFSADGRQVAHYPNENHAVARTLESPHQNSWLDFYWQQKLEHDNRNHGTLVIRASMKELIKRLSWFFGIGFAAMLISLTVTWTAFTSLRRKVSDTEDDLKRIT